MNTRIQCLGNEQKICSCLLSTLKLKVIFLIASGLVSVTTLFAQVGISSSSITPHSSSILELRSTTLGFLPPRMTTTERDAISSPATGLVIYNTTTNLLNFYNGSSWQISATGGVSSVSVTSANGFAGTVATATTTPAITISTTITGMLKGNGTAISAATSGTDYSLGTSGLATGILKSTTTTGALSIAVAGTDYQVPITTGDVTTSGATATIANGAVTLGKMANMATSSLIYRKTAGSGAPEVNTLATLKTDLGLTGTNSGDQTITLTGDVTGSGTGSFATAIAADAVTTTKILDGSVTYAKLQNVSTTDKVLGRVTAGAGDVEEISTTGTGNVVRATSPTLVTPVLGTPTSITLTNATGLPIGTGVSGLGTGIATFLATPSSANLLAAVTGETGTGSLVFGTSPTLTTPVLGTPTSVTLTNGTGLPISTGVSGLGTGIATFLATPSSANLASAITDETGTGSLVLATSPTLVTPVLGVATGTSLAVTGAITSSSPSAGIGYATGAGLAVTQTGSRSTGVTINAVSGAITTNATSLAAGAEVQFTVTNSRVAIGDVVVVSARSGQTTNTSVPIVTAVANGSFQITLTNLNASVADTGAMIINFVVIKAVSN